ncbi:T9SS type A sorting domain-containing protein [candidate division KSB1 bacterium]|nr:T9SS type A sorting domain-containing protein [candidate division KSB1 bacterium]
MKTLGIITLINVFVFLLFMLLNPAVSQEISVEAGYKGPSYGDMVTPLPSGEKSQSKLWWQDDKWWAYLWNGKEEHYSIYRYDPQNASWQDTQVRLDDRPRSKADLLWDGNKLYIATHRYSHYPETVSEFYAARLYRLSYDQNAEQYSLDAGFPVNINNMKSESLTLAKDSSGQLWITWTAYESIWLNRSLQNDATWGEPFVLPLETGPVERDDISAIVALPQGEIGVMWSDQNDMAFYFTVHKDSDADTVWQHREVVLKDDILGAIADDHINMAVAYEDSTLYAVTKTSLSGSNAPLIYLLKRSTGGEWSKFPVSEREYRHAEPIVLLNEESDQLYILAMSDKVAPQMIYLKSTSTRNIRFAPGLGAPVIAGNASDLLNEPTSTKQNLDAGTGLMVMASDEQSRHYYYNYIDLGSEKPQLLSITPSHFTGGQRVMLGGIGFESVNSIFVNDSLISDYEIVSENIIYVTVPDYISSGKLRVRNAFGDSERDFSRRFRIHTIKTGEGNIVIFPDQNAFDKNSTVQCAAVPAPGWTFDRWEGDLSGKAYLESLLIDSEKTIHAHFIPRCDDATAGISHTWSKSAFFTNKLLIKSPLFPSRSNGNYLVSVTTLPPAGVDYITGHSLEWLRLNTQVSTTGGFQTDIWMARGDGPAWDAVTAILADRTKLAIITVSEFSGTDSLVTGTLSAINSNLMPDSTKVGGLSDRYSVTFNKTFERSLAIHILVTEAQTHNPIVSNRLHTKIDAGSEQDTLSIYLFDTPFCTNEKVLSSYFNTYSDWTLQSVEVKGKTTISSVQNATHPNESSLVVFPNYPNPFNPSTRIRFQLSQPGRWRVSVYDILGRELDRVFNRFFTAGNHEFEWTAKNQQGQPLSSGIYFVHFQSGTYVKTVPVNLNR